MNYEQIFQEIYDQLQNVEDIGKVADYIPELARVNPDRFGVQLTTIATALTETGSKMDDVVFEEKEPGTWNFNPTANSPTNAFSRPWILWPRAPVDDLLLSEETLNRMWVLRNFLSDMNPAEAMEFLLNRLRRTSSNEEFLISMNDRQVKAFFSCLI